MAGKIHNIYEIFSVNNDPFFQRKDVQQYFPSLSVNFPRPVSFTRRGCVVTLIL
jgi:hypothetical protein